MNLNSLNILLAQAGTGGATQPNPAAQTLQMVVTMALIGIVFYFLLIRPQSKRAKEQAAMLKTIKAGDKITTSSGIVGVVVAVKDKTISMRSAETKLEVLKSAVSDIDRSVQTTANAAE